MGVLFLALANSGCYVSQLHITIFRIARDYCGEDFNLSFKPVLLVHKYLLQAFSVLQSTCFKMLPYSKSALWELQVSEKIKVQNSSGRQVLCTGCLQVPKLIPITQISSITPLNAFFPLTGVGRKPSWENYSGTLAALASSSLWSIANIGQHGVDCCKSQDVSVFISVFYTQVVLTRL